MAEVTAVSGISVLPDEVMIEILSRVDSSNHLELRCVCKLWKSLVLDPHFMQNQLLISIADLAALRSKVPEHFNAFKARIINNLTVLANAEEGEDVDAHGDESQEDEEDPDAAEEEDADGAEEDGVGVDVVPAADVDSSDAEEDGVDVDVDDDGDGADAEEEDAEDEEDLEEEEDEEEQLKTKVLPQLVNLAEKEKQLMKNGKNLNNHDEHLMIIRVAGLDNILRVIRYMQSFMLNFINSMEEDRVVSKGNLETIRVEIRTMEDRVTCFESFQQIYLKGLQHC